MLDKKIKNTNPLLKYSIDLYHQKIFKNQYILNDNFGVNFNKNKD